MTEAAVLHRNACHQVRPATRDLTFGQLFTPAFKEAMLSVAPG